MKSIFIFLFILFVFKLQSAERPNVLFIIVDDLNTRLGCYGYQHMKTPHIDAFSKTAVRFERAYCQYPSCGPSRSSFLTGLRPGTVNVLSNKKPLREAAPQAVTLPQLFKQNGYFTARVGKVYHQRVPKDIGSSGADDPKSWVEFYNPAGRDKYETHLLTVHTPQLGISDSMSYLKADGADSEQTDGLVVDKTIELLKRKRDRPFFIAAGLYRPHLPYIAPKKYFDLYSVEKTFLSSLPANYKEKVPAAALASTPEWPNFGTTARQAKECVLAYDACVSFVDAQIGRLLETVKKQKLIDNTIIVLMGDHGYHLGEHGLWRKNSLFEESARTPLFIYSPKFPGGVCKSVVEFINIYPTVVKLAGLKVPANVEGISMVPLMQKPLTEWGRPAFTETHFKKHSGYSVRIKGWRYTEWGTNSSGGRELYNEQLDPQEMNNLADKPEHKEILIKLKKLIHENYFLNVQ